MELKKPIIIIIHIINAVFANQFILAITIVTISMETSIAVNAMDVSYSEFIRGLRSWFRPWDAWFGLIKGLCFGFAITSIACYHGFYTTGGAKGVGEATTNSVVSSCIAIVCLDYILSSVLL